MITAARHRKAKIGYAAPHSRRFQLSASFRREQERNNSLRSLYIESTIPSYATARDSRDLIRFHRQVATRVFGKSKRHLFRLVISQAVFNECGRGDPDAAQRRLELLEGIEVYPITARIQQLAGIYRQLLNIPERAITDCIHLAVCATHNIDFLLTWNCTHLGPEVQKKVQTYNEKNGLWTPLLVTPETIAGALREG